MISDIGNINSNNYGFDYSNPVETNDASLKTSENNNSKPDNSKTDTFKTTNKESNIAYTKSGKINTNTINKSEIGTTDSIKMNSDNGSSKDKTISGEKELKPDEKKENEDLQRIDTEVKAHEQAHMSAGGGLVRGGVSYQYQKGPDGKMYAVGGEVQIDISPVSGNPEATISKMQQIKSAALAPADPSAQDKQVAGVATQIESQALEEKQLETNSDLSNSNESVKTHSTAVSKLDSHIMNKYFYSSNPKTGSKINALVS